jgi:UDPglucose--hexose-1-phosphate uridylyltransferase
MDKKDSFNPQLRFDLVSKDWIIVATRRAKRPEAFKAQKRINNEVPEKGCPFCNIETQKEPVLISLKGQEFRGKGIPKDWTVVVVPNLYPATVPGPDLEGKIEGGIYKTMKAVGFHELLITRNHFKILAEMEVGEMEEVLDVLKKRYLVLMREKHVNYISIFQNYGVEAGSSVFHPHCQIITTPLIDVDLSRALENSGKYFKEKGECMYCRMVGWERKVKKRIVFENDDFLVLCPFAPKAAFELIITPKKHLSYFEKITDKEQKNLAQAFKVSLFKIFKGLDDPPYNFYLHTAPCDNKDYSFYHWHWTILPRLSNWAGFELGTKMEISTIEPEKAAEYLRKQ